MPKVGKKNSSTGRAQIRQGAVVEARCGSLCPPPNTQPSSSSSVSSAQSPTRSRTTRSGHRSSIRGVVLYSAYEHNWVVYWFAIGRRSRIHQRHLTLIQQSSPSAFSEAEIIRYSDRSVGSIGDGPSALQVYVDNHATDVHDDGGGKLPSAARSESTEETVHFGQVTTQEKDMCEGELVYFTILLKSYSVKALMAMARLSSLHTRVSAVFYMCYC